MSETRNATELLKRVKFALTKGHAADFMAAGYGELTAAGNSDLIFDAQRELRLLRYALLDEQPAVSPEHRPFLPTRVDFDRLNVVVRKQKAALTRAVNSGDRDKILATCKAAVAEWNKPGMMWPDDWPRWQNALDNVYEVFHAPRLEDLAR